MTSQTWSTAGTYAFTVPSAGVTSLRVQCWAAGAGGAAAGAVFALQLGYEPSETLYNAGGGGSGEYAEEPSYAVTANEELTVTVGAAGAAGVPSGTILQTNGQNGANTTVGPVHGTPAVIAHGGHGGTSEMTATLTAPGGAGGSGSGNAINYPGATGGTGNDATGLGGGGASSAGPSSAGNPGQTPPDSQSTPALGGAAVSGGGAGGGGGSNGGGGGSGGDGQGGAGPGGAGGGGSVSASDFGSTVYYNGGNGADGQVIFTWTVEAPSTSGALLLAFP
jgi:hypothetical protein